MFNEKVMFKEKDATYPTSLIQPAYFEPYDIPYSVLADKTSKTLHVD